MAGGRATSRTWWWLTFGAAIVVPAASAPEAAVCNPGAPELCNGLDEDCDGVTDEDPTCPSTCPWPGILSPIEDMAGGTSYIRPSLVWNGEGYGVLVGPWPSLRFARLDADGHLIGGPTIVGDVSTNVFSVSTSTVWTGSHYGIAWTGRNGGVSFVRLEDTGQPILPASFLAPDPNRRMTDVDLVWTGTGYGLLLADQSVPDDTFPSRLFFVRLDAFGAALGPRILLGVAPTIRSPRLVWAGDGYGAVWDEQNTGITFRRLGVDGTYTGAPLPVSHSMYAFDPEIVWTGTHFAIAWNARFLTLVDAGGASQGPDVEMGQGFNGGGQTSMSWTGSEILAVWPGSYSFLSRRFGGDGLPLGDVHRLANGPTGYSPQLAWNGSDFGISYIDYPGVKFARVGCSCFDEDGDTWTVCEGDCDDSRANIHPGLSETCDGLDQDCDTFIDEGLDYQFSCGVGACRRTVTYCFDGAVQACVPGTPSLETCNGIDDDCDSMVDGDSDRDGFPACSDCRENVASIYPGAPEICNGADENCNGLVDDLNGVLDGDGDGVVGACDSCPSVANPLQEDTDGDGRADACDNCPDLPNASQVDTDGDGVGNACDVCVLNGVPTPDSDSDGFGDACDNCSGLGDRTQGDSDHDGEGNVCDYNDGLPLLWALSSDGIAWQPDASFFFFDLYRGDLDVLRAIGVYTQDPASVPLAYRVCGLDSTFWSDDSPPPGKGVFYQLVTYKVTETGTDILGIGNDSSGNPRPNTWPCDPPPIDP